MAPLDPQQDSNMQFTQRSELLLLCGMLCVIVVLLIPLPTFILDMLLAINLGMSVLLLLVTLSAKHSLEISVFPSLLLLLTLYRISINVATTRLILLDGDAGKIVSTFGGFVVGNSLVVGVVIFLILVVIQFIVITKGASRISEVNARFVLDALPGKQMAIDAELGAGAINENDAKARRAQLTREAEFYGAMDGASKYVRGDAIAGLIITSVNIIGGMIIGMSQGRSIGEAAQLYTLLTIGDGLMSQIPALIIATTAGILVTKASSDESLGQEVGSQMLSKRQPLIIGSVVFLVIGLTPGLPMLPFLSLSLACFLFSRRVKNQALQSDEPSEGPEPGEATTESGLNLTEFISSDRVIVDVGASLIPLVESKRVQGLAERITNLRKELTQKHGFWIPAVRIRDNLTLGSNAYQVSINGRVVAKGEVQPNDFLAIDPGKTSLEIDGVETTEPAFGLPAKWIPPTSKQRAELGGFTVVDAPTVMLTHLGEIFRKYAHELLGPEDLQEMLEKVKATSPTVVEELKPDIVRSGTLRRVLADLLSERVPIKSLDLILESVAHHGQQFKDPLQLCDRVREDIGQIVCERFRNGSGNVMVIVLDPKLESQLREYFHEGKLALPPKPLENLIEQIRLHWEKHAMADEDLAVLSDQLLRRPLKGAIERACSDVAVISYTEVPSELMIEPAALIRYEDIFPDTDPNPTQPTSTEENDINLSILQETH